MATITVNGNVGTVTIPNGINLTLKAMTNSRSVQTVTITDGNAVQFVFTGSGETNTLIGMQTCSPAPTLVATFTYQGPDGATANSSLQSGGPYQVGKTNFIVVVAENGDDKDYNDCVLYFTWSGPV